MNLFISLPITVLILLRAYRRNSLTPVGLVAAGITAVIHSLHPSPVPFTLLGTFFITGTTATKIHHERKATLTMSPSGESGGEGPRTHMQVWANSGVASGLILLYVWRYGAADLPSSWRRPSPGDPPCPGFGTDILLAGVVANYAAVCADTLSSELGILSSAQPRLITAPWRAVARGTNGGVTLTGLAAGALGGFIIALAAVGVGTFCDSFHDSRRPWTTPDKLSYVLTVTSLGLLGTVTDSVLGSLLQASVLDRRTGKVVEGAGGTRVLISPKARGPTASRTLGTGHDLLDNNQINLAMAAVTTLAGMAVASWQWGVSLA